MSSQQKRAYNGQYLTENDLFDIFAYSDRDFNSLFVSFRSAPAIKQKKIEAEKPNQTI